MPTETPPAEERRAAIERLCDEDLIRLRLVARVFDPRRHEDLLQEAISRTLSGERKWRDGVQLFWHLHEAMRSIAWDWAKKGDENLVLDSQSGADGSEAGYLAGIESAAPDPERQAGARMALERIIETCGADPIVVGLLRGKLQGKTGPEIRDELQLSQKDFSATAQRIRRSAKALFRGRRYA
jgi:DNA-directed RNA polymerase specialized sigma24 family protein